MSIKPVDMQVLIPRTVEVSKTQNDDQHKNHALAQSQNASVQNKADNDVKLVHSQLKPKEARIMEKQEKNKQDKKGEKKKKKGNYGPQKDLQEDGESSIIDVRL